MMNESTPVMETEIKLDRKKFIRGRPLSNKPRDKESNYRTKQVIKRNEARIKDAVENAAKAEVLLTTEPGFIEAEGLEKTYRFSQADIIKNVGIASASKNFNLELGFGPYTFDYTRNGAFTLIGGNKGHLASFDWRRGRIRCEINVEEKIRDVKWLHNENFFAAAQSKYVYIYDHKGVEVHALRKHMEVLKMDFLPYHFLLCTIGKAGYLRYQDVSTGQLVSEIPTKLGSCSVMSQNPQNAIMHLGHSNGAVTLWSPSVSTPLVKMLCHRNAIQALAVDFSGNYMATSGLDGQLKLWDIRTYKPLQSYFSHSNIASLSISQLGLIASASGPHVNIWRDAFKTKQNAPYLHHLLPGKIVADLNFCPYDDVLGISHSQGIESILVPGSGEPNFDSYEVNPFSNKRQRQETEVKGLLEKIQPDLISIHSGFVGTIQKDQSENALALNKADFDANSKDNSASYQRSTRKRTKNRPLNRYLTRNPNLIDFKKVQIQEKLEKQRKEKERAASREGTDILSRFAKKY